MFDVKASKATLSLRVLIILGFIASPAVFAESPWYVVAKLGQASVEEDFGPRILGWRVDDEDSSAGVEVGYRFNPNFGLQAGYRDLGTYPGMDRPCPPGLICPATFGPQLVPVFPREAEFSGLSLVAVPRWSVGEHTSLYGKLGALYWESDLTRTQGNPQEEPSSSELLAGVGAEYTFASGLGLLVEYETSDLLSAVSVGASWRF